MGVSKHTKIWLEVFTIERKMHVFKLLIQRLQAFF